MYGGVADLDKDNLRILELGCGKGLNCHVIAQSMPEATVFGVDCSYKQLEEAEQRKKQASLSNLHFERVNIDKHKFPPNSYDIIIVHGVYSWVPLNIQRTILNIAKESLVTGGVLFLSYNIAAGWNLKGTVRQFLLSKTAKLKSNLKLRVELAQQIAREYEIIFRDGPGICPQLSRELANLTQKPLSYIAHEYLAPVNIGFEFKNVVERAWKKNLAYIGDARPWTHWRYTLGQADIQKVESLSDNWMERENIADFLQDRSFRRSLFVKSDDFNRSFSQRNPIEGSDAILQISSMRDLHFRLAAHDIRIISPDMIEVTGSSLRRAQLQGDVFLNLVQVLAEKQGTFICGEEIERALHGKYDTNSIWKATQILFLSQALDVFPSTIV